jgi:hypothetical protein
MSLEHSPVRDVAPDRLADDLLTGIRAIAEYTGEPPRRTEYLASRGLIPTFKVGDRICARKSELAAAYSANRHPAA